MKRYYFEVLLILICFILSGCFTMKTQHTLIAPFGGEWKDDKKEVKVEPPLSGVFDFINFKFGGEEGE